jgi:hypothetical protein
MVQVQVEAVVVFIVTPGSLTDKPCADHRERIPLAFVNAPSIPPPTHLLNRLLKNHG